MARREVFWFTHVQCGQEDQVGKSLRGPLTRASNLGQVDPFLGYGLLLKL